MSKILESIQIKNCDTLRIFKRERSKFWYCKFYIGKNERNRSGMFECSLKTINQKEAVKLAKELGEYLDYDIKEDAPVNSTGAGISMAPTALGKKKKKKKFDIYTR
mgnify:CR=1 FL=1